jgi:hypothetical protein
MTLIRFGYMWGLSLVGVRVASALAEAYQR